MLTIQARPGLVQDLTTSPQVPAGGQRAPSFARLMDVQRSQNHVT